MPLLGTPLAMTALFMASVLGGESGELHGLRLEWSGLGYRHFNLVINRLKSLSCWSDWTTTVTLSQCC